MDGALRRHYEEVTKKKAQQLFYMRDPWVIALPEEEYNRHLGIAARTPHRCSGRCCGNPRKHEGLKTVQERRVESEFAYQLEDL